MRGNVRIPLPDLGQVEVDDAGAPAPRYQAERLTESELRRMLGFETRYELDGFVKGRGVLIDAARQKLLELHTAFAALRGSNFRFPSALFDMLLEEHQRMADREPFDET